MVDRQDVIEGLLFGQVDEGRVREIHGSVSVARHECVERWEVTVNDRRNGDCARPDEPPRGFDLPTSVSHEVKELREHSSRREKREPNNLEGGKTWKVPRIVAVEQSQNDAGVDEAASGHGVVSAARERPHGHDWRDRRRRR